LVLPQLDQSLGQPDESWKWTFVSTIPWQMKEGALQPFGEVDRGALPVRLGVVLRLVQDAAGVAVVVVAPVGHRPHRGAGGEGAGRGDIAISVMKPP